MRSDLEETVKEKVLPLVEETMEKSWGIIIPKVENEITDKLASSLLKIYIPSHFTFKNAKKKFKAEFLKNELRIHKGNVSQLAKMLGIDRRSVHRVIQDLDINMEEIRSEQTSNQNYEQLIDKTIRSTLNEYKEIIQPQKMEKFYQEIPTLSRNIAKVIPHEHLTWKQAEHEFEKQFLIKVLTEHEWDITKSAKEMKIRTETLYRKIKKLGLKKST